MNFMQHLDFSTVAEGEQNVIKARELRDSMGGDLYWNACNDDVMQLESKLEFLKAKEKHDKESQ